MNVSDIDEQKLRYFAWIYTALFQRRETPVSDEKSKFQKQNDLKQMQVLKEKMKDLSSFKRLSNKQQNSLLESGSAKLFKHWNKIFEESGFSEKSIFAKLYYILAAYSHSEGLSVIQIKTAKYFINNENNSDMTFFQTFSSLMMTSVMITNIIAKHDAIAKRFEDIDEKIKFRVRFYAKIGKWEYSE